MWRASRNDLCVRPNTGNCGMGEGVDKVDAPFTSTTGHCRGKEMGKFVKVLASSALAAGSCMPSAFEGAIGQTVLAPVVVNGNSGGGGSGGSGSTGTGFGGYSGGGGCQSCGGYPEGEYGGGKPAPPPKSEKQKEEEREKCEAARKDSREELFKFHETDMNECATRNSTLIGYFAEQTKQFLHETAGAGPGSCATNLKRQHTKLLNFYDERRDVCLKAVDKG